MIRESFPTGRCYRTAQSPGIGARRWNAFENLPVLEFIERLKVEDNRPAAKAAKQTNPLRRMLLARSLRCGNSMISIPG